MDEGGRSRPRAKGRTMDRAPYSSVHAQMATNVHDVFSNVQYTVRVKT